MCRKSPNRRIITRFRRIHLIFAGLFFLFAEFIKFSFAELGAVFAELMAQVGPIQCKKTNSHLRWTGHTMDNGEKGEKITKTALKQ